MDGDHVAAPGVFVEADRFRAEGPGPGRVEVGVVEEDVQVERAQQLDDPAADAGGADDSHGRG